MALLAMVVSGDVVQGAADSGGKGDALAQRLADWQKVETSPETKAYREALKNGGALDEARRRHLEEVILPQLKLDSNHPIITKVRHRIPAIALKDASKNPQAYAAVAGIILQFAESVARDEKASLVARVNAAILLGELESTDGRPLVDSFRPLLALATDASMPIAVRLVSFSEVTDRGFLETVRKESNLRDSLVEAASSIIQEFGTSASGEEALPRRWMAAKAVDVMPQLLDELPAETAAILSALVREKIPVDLRIRGAVVLGRISTARSKVDVSALVDAIEDIAKGMLAADEEIGRNHEGERILTANSMDPMAVGAAMGPSAYAGAPVMGPADFPGGSAPGGGFGGSGFFGPGSIEGAGMPSTGFSPTMVPAVKARSADSPPELIYRRTSWRLLQLVRALEGDDGTAGLAALGSDEETSRAKELAGVLINGGDSLDETPDLATLRKLLAVVSPTSPDEDAAAAGDGEKPKDKPAPVKPQPNSPFDPFQ